MKRKENEPGAPVECELVGLFHCSHRDLDNNKVHPEVCICPDEACPGVRVCPDEVHPGMHMCPNDTSHDVLTMLENTGYSLDDRWARERHNECYWEWGGDICDGGVWALDMCNDKGQQYQTMNNASTQEKIQCDP